MCEGSDTLNMTVISTSLPVTETTSQPTFSAMDQMEPDYPFWHVIFWVSPHFQAFVVSTSIILFALPVSYLTGIFSFIQNIIWVWFSHWKIMQFKILMDINKNCETSWACPDDPYEKRLQIELFQSSFYPALIRNYFKLPEEVDDSDQIEEKKAFNTWTFYLWNEIKLSLIQVIILTYT